MAWDDEGMGDRPSGTVTFLFTDIEASTRRWQEDRNAMERALEAHDQLLHRVVESHGGLLFKHTGDGVCAAFESATDALAAAVRAQDGLGLPVRMGVHTGEAQERDGDYFGPVLNRAARIMDAGHGGQILVSSAAAALVQDPALIDLGRFRLRDLAESEHLWQMTGAGLRSDFPPLRVVDSFETNLQPQRSTFIGRKRELTALRDAIEATRLVTLTGVGGVGKTRLAVQVAADALPTFADGAWLCEFASVSGRAGVVDLIAASLEIEQQAGLTPEDRVIAALRRRHVLLVLDNCEHVLDDVADVVERILDTCPAVTMLATSREGLAVEGEQLFAVPSLPVVDDRASAAQGAVELFVDRAGALVDGFTLDDDNRQAVVELCRRLDGIPLAIELAASRVAALTPAEIVDHLDDRFRLLAGGRRRSRNRHQTLRGTIDWSHDLLDDRSQVAMRRLAVFGGSFDIDAARAVAAGDGLDAIDVVDVVSDLVAKSLLVAEPVGSQTRYRFLETLRQYAEERLAESGELDAMSALAADHLIGWVDLAVRGLLGPEEEAWIARVEFELPNLRRAVDIALDGEDEDRAFRLVAPFHHCVNGPASLVDRLAEGICDTFPETRHELAPATLTLAASSRYLEGGFDDTSRLAATADALADELGMAHLASAANLRGQAVLQQHGPQEAHDAMAEGVRLATEADEPHLVVANQSGYIFTGLASGRLDPAPAVALAREHCELADSIGFPTGRATSRWTLGATLFAESPEDALPEFLLGASLAPHNFNIDKANAGFAAIAAVVLGEAPTVLRVLEDRFFDWRRDANAGYLQFGLLAVAGAARLMDEPELAARLVGPLQDSPPVKVLPGPTEEMFETIRRDLGDADYERLTAEGEAMDFDDVVDLAAAFLSRTAEPSGPS